MLAVMCGIAVAARTAFIWLPHFKPMAAIVIIAGVAFGAESGFLVGAVSALVSNFIFGQGPWTPWQMFAFEWLGFGRHMPPEGPDPKGPAFGLRVRRRHYDGCRRTLAGYLFAVYHELDGQSGKRCCNLSFWHPGEYCPDLGHRPHTAAYRKTNV